ncbi:DUF92 domain-containing protein [Paenibacillus sp. 1P07SE]|uniref:DUF92 domain-containing protein n=1 Tax=Paenibacillus sp. 1P07SE TaxID=3132209 RepID=UPI0039A40B79
MQWWVDLTEWWWIRLLLGAAGSAAITWYAYRRDSLSLSGAWSAAVMGTAYVTFGGPVWFGCLIVFFITSTFWSRWKRRHRAKQQAEARYAKSGRRDAGQVWANGGLGLLLCLGHAAWPDPLWLYAFAGVMASANADTWATEIGALSRTAPRALVGGRPVSTGTSGGVTPLGSAAALAGAAVIGLTAAALGALAPSSPGGDAAGTLAWSDAAVLAVIAAVAGLAGAFADSWLGAVWQVMFRCPACGTETERAEHCGNPAERIRGLRWLTNDRVNLLASAAAGLLAALLGLWWLQ